MENFIASHDRPDSDAESGVPLLYAWQCANCMLGEDSPKSTTHSIHSNDYASSGPSQGFDSAIIAICHLF